MNLIYLFIIIAVLGTAAVQAAVSGRGNHTLKQGGVCFTFDDRYFDNWLKVLPLFDKYGVKATFFIYGKLNPAECSKVKMLQARGHAIGAHSMNHINIVNYCKNHTADEYLRQEIHRQLEIFRQAGITVSAFAYPYSCRSGITDTALLKTFRHLRTGGSLKPGEKLAECDKFFTPVKEVGKQAYFIAYGIDGAAKFPEAVISQIAGAMERVSKNNEIIVFYAHDISAHRLSPAVIEKIIKTVREFDLSFYSFNQLP
ncbi:MAG: polysaccharide deacetylase family protein [Victivallales bacterium]|nr:polysaccharide deacetylase family protein [Victivallales bacterium]